MNKLLQYSSLRLLGVLCVVYIAFVLHAYISSGPVRRDVDAAINSLTRGDPLLGPQKFVHRPDLGDITGLLLKIGLQSRTDWELGSFYFPGQSKPTNTLYRIEWNPSWTYNYEYYEERHSYAMYRSVMIPLGGYKSLLEWPLPVPIVNVVVVHLASILLVPWLVVAGTKKTKSIKYLRSFWSRSLRSSLAAAFVFLILQIGIVLWSSESWGREYLSTMMVTGLGSLTFYMYIMIYVLVYFYAIIITSGVCFTIPFDSSHSKCGFCRQALSQNARCTECGIAPGEYIPYAVHESKFKLVAFVILAFFTPVIIDSAYSVLL